MIGLCIKDNILKRSVIQILSLYPFDFKEIDKGDIWEMSLVITDLKDFTDFEGLPILSLGGNAYADITDFLPMPFKAASLIEKVRRLKSLNLFNDLPDVLDIGPYRLNVRSFSLSVPHERTDVRLTEKERDILLYLYKSQTDSVSKLDLLHAIWDYSEAIETHTLETHIYRLRQKIEKDPSNPGFLVTDGQGYKLIY